MWILNKAIWGHQPRQAESKETNVSATISVPIIRYLTRPVAREDFIEFSSRENFKSYNVDPVSM
jgi:hypothetical protein